MAVVSTEVEAGGGSGAAGRPWVTALVVAGVLVGQPALADDGLATGSRSRYVLDAKATTVDATMTIDLRNTTPNRGGLYYFFNAFSVPVPAGAEKVRARSGGSSLPVSLRGTDDPSTRLARISFPNLLYGRSRTITLTFEVPGEKPRAKDSTRVGPGYATFAVYGVGDDGRNTVEVVAPSGMTFEATSDDFTESEQGSTTTRTSTATSDDGGFWAVVSLRDPNRTDERVVDVAGVSLLLNGFQDDPKWGDFVARRVTTGIPALEKLVGTKWPGGLERIREDASPSLRGYDGWFDPSDDEIVIGEQLDADLLFHELSHAWVSGERFDERWVSEGLAQVLAERAVEGHRWHTHHPPQGLARRVGRRRAQLLGWLGRQPLGGRRRLRLPGRLRRHEGPGGRPRRHPARRGAGRRPAGRTGLRPRRHQGHRRRAHHVVALARPAPDPRRRRGRPAGLPAVGAHR